MKITKKFWVYTIIGGIIIYFSFGIINVVNKERERIKQAIIYCQNSNVIKEKEIRYDFCYPPVSLTGETMKELESKLYRKFWKEYFILNFLARYEIFQDELEDLRIISALKSLVSVDEESILGFYADGEYIIPFLKNTKIYKVNVRPKYYPDVYKSFVVGIQNGDKIFNLNNLKEINKLIKGEKIWLDTCSKAIKYAILWIELTTDYEIEIINLVSIEEFIEEFIVGSYGDSEEDEHGKWINYKTVQEYVRFFPKKYQKLLKYKNKIEESPQLIKKTKHNYEAMLCACETSRNELVLTKLKLTIYKTGEINLKKKYLVRKIKEYVGGDVIK